MPHRGASHARRRVSLWSWEFLHGPGDQYSCEVAEDFDAVRYDDVIRPALRVRATLRLDDDGEPAELVDLIAEPRLDG